MSKKNKSDKNGFVYSTDPEFKFDVDSGPAAETLSPSQQKLRIKLDKKHRGGKMVTLVEGFIGTIEDLEILGKNLKNFCGTGGTAKDNEVIIQGDQRDKVLQWLQKNGYSQVKKV